MATKKVRKIGRSSITGRFVSEEYVKANPGTTVVEKRKAKQDPKPETTTETPDCPKE